jgi:CheY-like chemotaxis protein
LAQERELRIARAIDEGTERAFDEGRIGINHQRTNPIMLDHNDLKWIASTSTDLNSILQQIARYCDLARRHKGEHNYIDLLGERVELAAKTAQGLFDRVTTTILASATGKAVPPGSPPVATAKGVPAFSVVPPPVRPVAQQIARTMATLHGNEELNASRAKTASRANAKIPSDIKIKNPKGNREYLLVVEDEPEVADLAGEMLAEEGYKVILAHDGFEALKIYEKMGERIGLVILDFFLPVMDGDAVFDELRGINPDVAVVLSSGFAEQSKIGAMLAQGLRGFIPKPYTREKLLEQVRSTLDATRQTARRD